MSLLRDITEAKPQVTDPPVVKNTMNLLKELANKTGIAKAQSDLKRSDASDAGKSDVVDKATAGQDVAFSLMRNTINSDGAVTGSDVADYIERAEELNDEVDTVPFGLETDDGQIVKVYVNAEQADKFEEAMKNMLGMEDDIEEAINRLTTEFDIVDVVWPKSEDEEGEEEVEDEDLEIADTSDLDDTDDFGDDQYDVVATADDHPKNKIDRDEEAKEEHPDEEDQEHPDEDEENPDEDEENPDENSEEEELDDEGRPKKKKKKKKPAVGASKPEPAEEATKEQQENNMTFGSRFLERVLSEATGEDRDGVKDNFNIPLDSQARALAAKLKLPLAKRLVAFHVMVGVPGRYLNSEEVEAGITGASDMLRKKVAVRRAFITFYDALANAKGFTLPAEGETVKEAKRTREVVQDEITALNKKIVQAGKDGTRRSLILDMEKQLTRLRNELKLMKEELDEAKKEVPPEKIAKAREAVKKAKAAIKDHEKTYDGGSGAHARKLQADLDTATTLLAKLTEEQLDEAPRMKRGSYMQKLLESVLTELGLPGSLISTTGPSAVGTGIYRTAEMVEQDSNLEQNLRLLATRLGIKANDAQAPIEEAVDLGQNDDFANAVVSLVSALGVPDAVLTSRKPQLIQGLRQRKVQLRNRQQIVTMMQRLEGLLTKSTITTGAKPEEEPGQQGGRPNPMAAESQYKHLSALQETFDEIETMLETKQDQYGVKVGQIYVRANGSKGEVKVLSVDKDTEEAMVKDSITGKKSSIDLFKLAKVRFSLKK